MWWLHAHAAGMYTRRIRCPIAYLTALPLITAAKNAKDARQNLPERSRNVQLITDYDTDFLGEVHLKVDYDYQPGEAAQFNPDHPAFGPGCDEGFDVTEVAMLVGDVYIVISDHVTEGHLDVLADLCAEDYHSE